MPTLEVVVLCHLNYSVSRIDVVSVEPYDCWCWAVWFLVNELHPDPDKVFPQGYARGGRL